MTETLWLPRQAAERLGVSERTVYRLAKADRLGGVVRVGSAIRIDPDALADWCRAGGEQREVSRG